MPGQPAAVDGATGKRNRVVYRTADQVVNDEGVARHAQSFLRKLSELFGTQVMHKQGRSHNVKAGITEGQRQGVSTNVEAAAVQMRSGAIKDDRMHDDSGFAERF